MIKCMKAICFSGIDGSGKSTHAHLLLENPLFRNIYFRYSWFRYPKVLSIFLFALSHRTGITTVSTSTNVSTSTTNALTWKEKIVCIFWPYIQLIDTSVTWSRRILSSYIKGSVLISDRSVVDTLVDVTFDVKTEALLTNLIGHLFISLLPKSALVFVFDLDATTAKSRKVDVHSSKALDEKRRYYNILCKAYGWKKINSNSPYLSIQKEIVCIAEVYLRGKNS